MSGTRVWMRRHDDHAQIGFPYSASAVAALKESIPWECRRWDKVARHWTVDEPYVADAVTLMRARFGSIDIADLRSARRPPRGADPADWADALLAALPEHLREPAYRALLRVLHPDVGGDTRLTQRLNDVFRRRAS
jgi:hypothetical protein